MAGVIVPGQEVECLCVAIELAKDRVILPNGKVYDRVGFKIGGGMDQDPNESPFRYPDTVSNYILKLPFLVRKEY